MIDHAIDCRNHYVHGNPAKLDYESVLDFLTNTLEFVYGVSELIECGWDSQHLAKATALRPPLLWIPEELRVDS